MLPSACSKNVGVLILEFSELNAQPTYTPVYASLCTSRYRSAKLGAGRIATPFP